MRRSPFQIGDIRADPARNFLLGTSGEITIEPKIMETLVYLTSRQGDVVLREDITHAVWPNSYSGDESLTRAVSRLRRAFQDIAGEANYIETIPKRGYRIVAPVKPIDDNPTANNTLQSQQAIGQHFVRGHYLKPMSIAAGSVLIFCAVALAFLKLTTNDASNSGFASADRQWTNRTIELSKIAAPPENTALQVVSNEVVNQIKLTFASTGIPVLDRSATGNAEIDSLPVRLAPLYRLQGSIRLVNDETSVILYLEDNRTQETFWSRQFTSPNDRSQRLSLEIAVRLAAIIECASRNIEAVDDTNFIKLASLTFSWCELTGIGKETLRTIELARQVREIQPASAKPHAMYAVSNILHLGTVSAETVGNERYYQAGKAAAEYALRLDPENEMASLALAMTLPSDKNLHEKEKLLLASGLERSEHGYSLFHYIDFLRYTGRLREALHYSEIAEAKAPYSPYYKAMTALLLALNGDTQQSVTKFQELRNEWPDHIVGSGYSRMLSLFNSEYDFSTVFSRELEFSACEQTFLSLKKSALGNQIDALENVCRKSSDPISMDYYIRMLATLGEVDAAYNFSTDYRFNWHGAKHFLFYPEMNDFRRDPRFFSSIKSSGLIEYWFESGEWPDFCEEMSVPYDCRTAAQNALVNNAPT